MRDRGAFGWAVRTGRGGSGRAGARPFTPRPGAHRPGAGPTGAGARTGSGLARPDGRTARADRWIQAELAGASAVGVGTASFLDPRAPYRVLEEFVDWCAAHDVDRARDLVGALEDATAEHKEHA